MKSMHSYSHKVISLSAALLLSAVLAVGQPSAPESAAHDPAGGSVQAASVPNAEESVESEPDFELDMIPQRLGILGAEVFLYGVSSGGIFEYRDDWSKIASRNAVISAALAFKRMGYEPTVVPDAALPRDIFNLKAKMRYHCMAFRSRFHSERSMYVRSMNTASKSGGAGSFFSSMLVDTVKYSIGSTDSLCNVYGVDGFVYVYGFQENRFEGVRLQPNGTAEAARRDDRARTYIAAILVGRNGHVLWYKDLAFTGALDLRLNVYSVGIVGALFE